MKIIYKHFSVILFYLLFPIVVIAQGWNTIGNVTVAGGSFLKQIDSILYVSQPDTADGISTFNFGAWNGNSWDSVGGGVDGTVLGVEKFNNDLIIVGIFWHAGGNQFSVSASQRIRDIGRWDGTQYHQMLPYSQLPFINYNEASATYNGEVYFGGKFQIANGAPCNNIAKWDGTNFSCVGNGSGITGNFAEVLCMIVYDGELIVGGRMGFVNGLPVNNIAKWNGTSWSAMGDGFDYYVRGFTIDSATNTLYASGTFGYSGTTQVNHVARWDGNTWQPIGNGLPTGGAFQCAMYHGKLYVGSYGSGVFYWDGSNWVPLSPNTNNTTQCVYTYKDELYVAGSFDSIGGIYYPHLARYSDAVGFSEVKSNKEEIIITPNPVNKTATVKLPELFGKYLPCTFKLYDITGKEVTQIKEINSLTFIINKNNLLNGLYIYKLFNKEKEISAGKVVVE